MMPRHLVRPFFGRLPALEPGELFDDAGADSNAVFAHADGTDYFCIARTVSRGDRGFGSPPAMHAVCLGCRVEHADKMVYADSVDLKNFDAAVPVGVTCRLCPRMDCEQRAFPPLQRKLEIDENTRGPSFYASLKEQ